MCTSKKDTFARVKKLLRNPAEKKLMHLATVLDYCILCIVQLCVDMRIGVLLHFCIFCVFWYQSIALSQSITMMQTTSYLILFEVT